MRVATAAGLVATKSHAAGYPKAARRANKHGGDLYDLFRLIEAFDRRGELRTDLAAAPGGLGKLVAQVVEAEILANPARAQRQMSPVASTVLDVGRIGDITEPFDMGGLTGLIGLGRVGQAVDPLQSGGCGSRSVSCLTGGVVRWRWGRWGGVVRWCTARRVS